MERPSPLCHDFSGNGRNRTCFVIYPVIYLFRFSLYRYNLLNPAQSRFIGLQNYEMMLQKAVIFTNH